MNISAAWKLALPAAVAAFVFACRPTVAVPGAAPRTGLDELIRQLNPVEQSQPQRSVTFTAPPPPNPATIFPVPIRPHLPPAGTSEIPRVLPGDHRTTTSLPLSPGEIPPLGDAATLPEPIRFLSAPLPPATVLDPAQIAVWITSSPAPEARGLPPKWDRPQVSTDPTGDGSRALALALPGGLRESPPPFLRLVIPDPFEQITIAELRNPPPDDEPPVRTFSVPANPLTKSAPAGK